MLLPFLGVLTVLAQTKPASLSVIAEPLSFTPTTLDFDKSFKNLKVVRFSKIVRKDSAMRLDIVPSMPNVETIIAALFHLLQIQADPRLCASDVGGVSTALRDFAVDLSSNNITTALTSLGSACSALSSAINDCQVPALQAKLDTFAAATKIANFTILNGAINVIVGASDLGKDITDLSLKLLAQDYAGTASALQALSMKFSAITGGCGNSGGCRIVDGILKMTVSVVSNAQSCKQAFETPYMTLLEAFKTFQSGNITLTITLLEKGLESLGTTLSSSCNLPTFGHYVSDLASKLSQAIVNGKSVIVGSIEVYDQLEQGLLAMQNNDIDGLGLVIGRLLQSLQASDCKSNACVVLQGVLSSAQIGVAKFATCATTVQGAFDELEELMLSVRQFEWGAAIEHLAKTVSQFAQSLTNCGFSGIGETLQKLANKLGSQSVVTQIKAAVVLLVEDTDVSDKISQMVLDIENKRWGPVGSTMVDLAEQLTNPNACNKVICHVVNGVINQLGTSYQNLQPCLTDLKPALPNFIRGTQSFGAMNITDGLKEWAAGLHIVAKSASNCGIWLEAQLAFVRQESQILGFANTTIGTLAVPSVLVHGAEIYQELYSTYLSSTTHDWRGMGQHIGSVVSQLGQWTEKHACKSNICYLVVGILQFLNDSESVFVECTDALKSAWVDLYRAVKALKSLSSNIIWEFNENVEALKNGVNSFASFVAKIGNVVTKCHLTVLTNILASLSVKLSESPIIFWIGTAVNIVLNGIDIAQLIGQAGQAFISKSWVEFGRSLGQLMSKLLIIDYDHETRAYYHVQRPIGNYSNYNSSSIWVDVSLSSTELH